MSNERSIGVSVLNELIGYFLHHGIDDLQMELHYQEDGFRATVKGECAIRPADLERLEEVINEPRQAELEEYYWGLLGATDRREINLLGAVVDKGEVTYENGILSVTVYRLK
ncbi:MAG: hypothetical protein SCK57_06890 [Bacillota bacterium]|nr:hypothetical protein [Bacillota bacterium]MDW7677372.1 hypothetical protein [Bacillota bacterium]